VQFAFQYTVIVLPEENFEKGPISLDRPKYSLKRRLKIRTLQYGVARNLNELYDSADTEVILSILVHKVISASLEQGVKEGRLLLHDWLVILTVQYNDAHKIVEFGKPGTTGSLDVAYSQLAIIYIQCIHCNICNNVFEL
jgi:hypothetical protein